MLQLVSLSPQTPATPLAPTRGFVLSFCRSMRWHTLSPTCRPCISKRWQRRGRHFCRRCSCGHYFLAKCYTCVIGTPDTQSRFSFFSFLLFLMDKRIRSCANIRNGVSFFGNNLGKNMPWVDVMSMKHEREREECMNEGRRRWA